MGLGKLTSMGEILSWPSTSTCGGVASVLDVCGLPSEYRDALKMPPALIHLFEKLHIVNALWQRREMNGCFSGLASTWAVRLATNTQLEAEA